MPRRPRAGPGDRDGAVDVVLVEADGSMGPDPADVAGSLPPGERGRSSARHGGRGRARGLVVLSVVVALVVGAGWVQDRAEQGRLAALAQVPGLVPPLEGPLEEVWRTTPGTWQMIAGGMVVRVDPRGVTAIDPVTGRERWTRAWPEAQPSDLTCGTDAVEPDGMWRAGGALLEADHVWCVVLTPEPGVEAAVLAPPVVVVLDALTGEQVTSWDLEGTPVLSQKVGQDLVVGLRTEQGRLRVVRHDIATGERRWEFVSDQDGAIGEHESAGWSFDGITLVWSGSTEIAVDLTDGSVVEGGEVPSGLWPEESADLPGGGVVEWSFGGETFRSRVLDLDGQLLFEIDGTVFPVPVTDGSVPEILLVLQWGVSPTGEGPGVTGVDSATGEQVWVSPVVPGYPVVQIDGLVLLRGESSVDAVDVTDGTGLWTVPTSPTSFWLPVSDGRTVLLPALAEDGTGDRVVAAVDLRTGQERWRTDLPKRTQMLTAVGGRLIALTAGDLVGLG
ncbi:PQQ-binding-like beta-propeller repeat protein [Actinotalea sp. K2]|uniref:outer membrane protein assembly factor BamB family protein n=1 Tax=Actinotalea sp. K2 TaxID=2939438 RepID=UPI0020173CF5|nr:PQQ-binding-like beta-propeller repeat protein [Actinotalea sp. K2]MCL3860614.1 PQQ-binding-like beta-propeller repeat protein [Actinotalea sp. K2]